MIEREQVVGPDGRLYDVETGMQVHVRMGFTADGQGPTMPGEGDFHHWGCWCLTPGCDLYKPLREGGR